MRLTFEAHGKTAAEIVQRARRRITEFAGPLRWEIVKIDVDKQLTTDHVERICRFERCAAVWLEKT